MPENGSRSLGKFLRRFGLSKQQSSKGKDDGNRQDGQVAPPAVPATLSTSAAMTDAGTSQTAKTEPVPSTVELHSQHAASSSDLPASSVPGPATTPSAEYPPPAAATKSPAREATSAQKEPAIQPEQLWDQAYDGLKRDEPKLFEFYETILSHDLDSSKGVKGNIIEQTDGTKRRSQMDGLLKTGLDNTAKLAKVEKNIGDAVNIVLSVKEAIGSGLQAVPVAALAWTGVCVALQVFLNPISESAANRDGIIQVVRNMKWYSSLSKLLLKETSENDERFAELRGLLADRILDLYKVLLKYIIKSVCAYHRHPALGILRNLVKLDDWTGSLDDVTKAENSVKAAAGDFGVRQANSYLGLLVSMHLSKAQDDIMQKCCVTDMTAEIESLQKRKDLLLADSYKWILDNQEYKDFTDWHHGNTKRLLWIKGDPGKGKTMLLIGVIRELTVQLETHFDNSHLSYFFCQGTNDKLNTATAILRGLIWMLLRQEKSLICHLDKFKDLGSVLFEDRNAFYNLKKILLDMLGDEALKRAYFVIDALDECRREEPGLRELLQLISEFSETQAKVKWLVSSRNEPEIEAALQERTTTTRLSLELNARSVASAVEAYIKCKMKDPKFQHKLQEAQDGIAKELHLKADGTFLWVALAFKQIEGCGADKALERVRKIPSGLDDIYAQMIRQVTELDAEDSHQCKSVLLTMVNAYRPLHLSELVALADLPELAVHEMIVRRCGLLTVKDDDDIVYFVHQSAKDYLIKDPNSDVLSKIFPGGCAEGHRTIVSRSLEAMLTTLQRDIYNLQHPGFSIDEVKSPDQDPLTPLRYACVYWVDHLCETASSYDGAGFCDEEKIDEFWRGHFLHWLEALSLMKSTSAGVFAIAKLIGLLMVASAANDATVKIWDASSGACIKTLEGHSDWVTSVAFSPDGTQVASASDDATVKIWDASSGACIKTLEGHSGSVKSVAFSPDGTQVASAADDATVKIWDASSGACIKTLEGHSGWVNSVAFSPDGTQVASAADDATVKIWDASSGACVKTLNVIGQMFYAISFDTTGLYLLTDHGRILLDISPASNKTQAAALKPQHHGYGLSADRAWITWNDRNVLWLPSEYRPLQSAIATSAIAIACSSGRVLTFKFSFEKSPLSQ
ncbi:hypothetical protein QBC46DRAFT_287372 [Diplogelasinospora grovesii]|uniref:NACHT domain-containing protein n=1 Tax=Diplogelasinospora grovesii TaxID=303347 RepID=A0AAN6N964_9PEZI|nr:hypothetical protein QBC46DRAFT_287372 [Diplogelasinospora grovesii]